MKFLVPNYSCLQNPWLGGYRPQIPVLSVPCPQLNLLNPPPNKIPGYATGGDYIASVINEWITVRRQQKQAEKQAPTVTFLITNPTWTDNGLKLGICDASPASSRLCHTGALLVALTNEMIYKYKIYFLHFSRFLASVSDKEHKFLIQCDLLCKWRWLSMFRSFEWSRLWKRTVNMPDIAVFHCRLISWPFCRLTFTPTNPDLLHRNSTTPHMQNISTSKAQDFLPYHSYEYSACAFV